jgi:hypothetical protein
MRPAPAVRLVRDELRVGRHWHPHAVKVGVGAVDAVGGGPWDLALRADPQDYLVVPDQPWLDGINAGQGVVRVNLGRLGEPGEPSG